MTFRRLKLDQNKERLKWLNVTKTIKHFRLEIMTKTK